MIAQDRIWRFKRDTAMRKFLFTEFSFSHPAKLDAQLLLKIVETFTKEGETILDPMFGSGTTMLACMLGRNVIGVELEQKFVDMAKANWEKVRQRPQLGSTMGTCQILQGDARNLSGLLVDKIISSPPYAESGFGKSNTNSGNVVNRNQQVVSRNRNNKIAPEQKARQQKYGDQITGNIASLPYGSIDSVITSPPYEATFNEKQHTLSGIAARDPKMRREVGGYSGKVDHIVTSPPYEGSLQGESHDGLKDAQKLEKLTKANPNRKWKRKTELTPGRMTAWGTMGLGYSPNGANIGNLKSTSYLSAMAQVYQQCYAVLRSGGLLLLITKNFIREQKEIRLDLDTIKLCEQAGFTFKERWYRELPAQSFWRILYKKKFPNAPELKFEDVLVFSKVSDELRKR